MKSPRQWQNSPMPCIAIEKGKTCPTIYNWYFGPCLYDQPIKQSKHAAVERPNHESSDLPKHGSSDVLHMGGSLNGRTPKLLGFNGQSVCLEMVVWGGP